MSKKERACVCVCVATIEHPVNVKLGIGPLLNFELTFAKCNAASGSLSFFSLLAPAFTHLLFCSHSPERFTGNEIS